jgi:hypothetical protein
MACGAYDHCCLLVHRIHSFANPAVTLARRFTTTFAGLLSITSPHFIVAEGVVIQSRSNGNILLFAARAQGQPFTPTPYTSMVELGALFGCHYGVAQML